MNISIYIYIYPLYMNCFLEYQNHGIMPYKTIFKQKIFYEFRIFFFYGLKISLILFPSPLDSGIANT